MLTFALTNNATTTKSFLDGLVVGTQSQPTCVALSEVFPTVLTSFLFGVALTTERILNMFRK